MTSNKRINVRECANQTLQFIQYYPRETIGVMLGFLLFQLIISFPILFLLNDSFFDSHKLLVQTINFSQINEYWIFVAAAIILSIIVQFLHTSYFIHIVLKYAFFRTEPQIKIDLIHASRFIFILFVSYLVFLLTVIFGLLLLIIPGLIFAIAFFLYDFALLQERVPIFSALSKSWGLTSGVRWQVLLLVIIFIFILGTLTAVIERITGNMVLTGSLISNAVNTFLFMLFILFWGFAYKNLHQQTFDPIDLENEYETPDPS